MQLLNSLDLNNRILVQMFGGQAALSMNYALKKLRFLEFRNKFTNN